MKQFEGCFFVYDNNPTSIFEPNQDQLTKKWILLKDEFNFNNVLLYAANAATDSQYNFENSFEC